MKITDLPGMKPGSRLRNGVVGVVYIFIILAVIGAVAPPDDGGTQAATDGGTTPPADTAASTQTSEQQTDKQANKETEEQQQTTTQKQTTEQTQASTGFQIKVSCSEDCSWSGSFGTLASSRTVDGTGDQTIDIEGSDIMSVSASVQKQGSGDATMTVQILKDGDVVKESATSAEYGVVTVNYSNL